MGYAIITRYEIETQKVRSLLISNLRVYHDIKRWEIESTIQGFFTRNRDYHLAPELKEDYRSEICHIRNAFAHSHVKFVNDGLIELWDRFRNRNGHYIETFRKRYSIGELIAEYDWFEERISFGIQFLLFISCLGHMPVADTK